MELKKKGQMRDARPPERLPADVIFLAVFFSYEHTFFPFSSFPV